MPAPARAPSRRPSPTPAVATATGQRRPTVPRHAPPLRPAAAAGAGPPVPVAPPSARAPPPPLPAPATLLAADVQTPPPAAPGRVGDRSAGLGSSSDRAASGGGAGGSGRGGPPDGGPDPDFFVNVGHAIRTLRDDIPALFAREMDWSIYRDDVVFRDPRNCFRGLRNYKIIFWSLRFHGKLFFSALRVDVSRIWQPDPREVRVRWTIVGHPRGPFSPTTVGIFDGVSTFKLDSKGLVYEHAVDNVILRPRGGVLPASPLLAGMGLAGLGGGRGGGPVAVPGGAGGGGGGGDPGFPCPNFTDENGDGVVPGVPDEDGTAVLPPPPVTALASAAAAEAPPPDLTRLAAARAALAAAFAASSSGVAASLTSGEDESEAAALPGRGPAVAA